MRNHFILFLLPLLISCNSNQGRRAGQTLSSTEDLTFDTAKIARWKVSNTEIYQRLTDRLDRGDLASVGIARRLLQNGTSDTLLRDSLFVVYTGFLNRLAEDYLENNEKVSSLLEDSPYAETIGMLTDTLANYGLLLGNSGGTFYVEPQIRYLLRNPGPALSHAYREYLSITADEQEEPFTPERGILIRSDSLASRIVRWERFMTQYPAFISIRLARDQYSNYLGTFLSGMENSGVFDPETKLLNDSVKTRFETFIGNHPENKSASVVRDYLELLGRDHFRYTEKVDSFLLDRVYGE